MRKILLVLTCSLLLGGCNLVDVHQPLGDSRLPLSSAAPLAQSFLASAPDLNIVSLCLRNPSRSLAKLEFTLHEATTSAQPLRTISFTGGNIDNQDCTRFQFPPVPDSLHQTYLAQVRYLPEALDPKLPPQPIYLEAHDGEDYQAGVAYLAGTPTAYDLHFRTNYYQPLSQTITSSVLHFLQRLPQDPAFLFVYTLLVGLTLYLLWRRR